MKNEEWYFLDNKHNLFGTFSSKELISLYLKKEVTDRNFVWRNGFGDWRRFGEIRPTLTSLDTQSNFQPHFFENSDIANREDSIRINTISSTTEPKVEIPVERIDYSKPYKVVWLSNQHKVDTTQLTNDLAQNLIVQKKLESFRLSPNSPDGLIIGTGEADFTKGNVPYEFEYNSKTFQLIDVPGIEGDEGKYEHLVKQAIEKAHLVIYVNGTNKKPEVNTTNKIKQYINQYAKIYAICNVRGQADSYEFPEDQISLASTHKDIDVVLSQTLETLNQSVGSELIEGGQCVQGLLAFSALAYDYENKETTISHSRKDLIKNQKSYLRDFGSSDKMKLYSGVDLLEEKIASKFSTFEQDIIEANKIKVIRKVEEIIAVIQEQLNSHLKLQHDIKKELDAGKTSINQLLTNFDNSLTNKSSVAVNTAFLNIIEDGEGVIETYFGDEETITSRIQQIVNRESNWLTNKLENEREKAIRQFSTNLQESIQRLGKSIEQVQINFELSHQQNLNVSMNHADSSSIFDTQSLGKSLLEIGGTTVAGVGFGTVFPGLGNMIGGIGGFLVGVFKVLWDSFKSKQSKINKVKSKFRNDMNSKKTEFNSKVRSSVNEMLSSLRSDLSINIFEKIDEEYQKMQDVERILTSQIQSLTTFSNQIKGKEYGTI